MRCDRRAIGARAGFGTLAPLVALVAATGCELQEVTIADPEPFVVVESYLFGGQDEHRVAIHGGLGSEALLDVPPTILLTGPAASVRFVNVADTACLAPGVTVNPIDFPGGFRCYGPVSDTTFVTVPGELYRLSVVLGDGSRLDGATRVPAQVAFSTAVHDSISCYLPPGTQAELSWSRVPDAAAYLIDLRAFGLREALARDGVDVDVPDPFVLRGLAIGADDTTIVLPREFGLFDRFSLDAQLTLALQRGVPEGVGFEVLVSALDQNYVDWVRGGDFNPSGLIRTPSLFGSAGTGVFGSLTSDFLRGTTAEDQAHLAPCGPAVE